MEALSHVHEYKILAVQCSEGRAPNHMHYTKPLSATSCPTTDFWSHFKRLQASHVPMPRVP